MLNPKQTMRYLVKLIFRIMHRSFRVVLTADTSNRRRLNAELEIFRRLTRVIDLWHGLK